MPPEVMTIMIGFYIVAALIIAALATGNILAGVWLKKRIQHSLTFVIAAINCAFFPFGTVLSVFFQKKPFDPYGTGVFPSAMPISSSGSKSCSERMRWRITAGKTACT